MFKPFIHILYLMDITDFNFCSLLLCFPFLYDLDLSYQIKENEYIEKAMHTARKRGQLNTKSYLSPFQQHFSQHYISCFSFQSSILRKKPLYDCRYIGILIKRVLNEIFLKNMSFFFELIQKLFINKITEIRLFF